MATHSSVLAWRIPGTGKPGGLPSVGLHRVGHDWSDLAAAAAAVGWVTLLSSFITFPICFRCWMTIDWLTLSSLATCDVLERGSALIMLSAGPCYLLMAASHLQSSHLLCKTYWPPLHCRFISTAAAAAAAKLLQSCPTLCDPRDGSPPGLPFPSPMQESEKWKWSGSVVSDSSRPHGLQPTRLLRPWDSPGRSAGVGAIAFSLGQMHCQCCKLSLLLFDPFWIQIRKLLQFAFCLTLFPSVK